MKFRIVLECDPGMGSFSAICPDVPGCASAGEAEEKARQTIDEAMKLYLAPTAIDLPGDAKLVEVMIG